MCLTIELSTHRTRVTHVTLMTRGNSGILFRTHKWLTLSSIPIYTLYNIYLQLSCLLTFHKPDIFFSSSCLRVNKICNEIILMKFNYFEWYSGGEKTLPCVIIDDELSDNWERWQAVLLIKLCSLNGVVMFSSDHRI